MARAATISKNDVYLARDALRLQGLPHGITAIRKRLGRGSPGLISQHLREIDGSQTAPQKPLPKDAINDIATQLIEALRTQSVENNLPIPSSTDRQLRQEIDSGVATQQLKIANKTISEQSAHISQLRRDVMALERQLSATQAENASYASNVSALQEELEMQRNMFESWRRDHVRDRALLSARIEMLGNALDVPKQIKTRKTAEQSIGEQLDLYGQPVDE